MPPPERICLTEDAVLWPILGYDPFGQPIVSDSPQGIKVRWTVTRGEAFDRQGNTVTIDAMVQVNQRIEPDSNMWRGAIGDLPPGTSFQGETEELMIVKTYKSTKDIKGREANQYVELARYRDTLPQQESP